MRVLDWLDDRTGYRRVIAKALDEPVPGGASFAYVLGSVLVGMAFGAGWTPCIGPILGAILSMATVETDVARGMGLLAAYSAGLAVPFLLAALAVDSFLDWFQRFRKYLPWVMRVSGMLLILVGMLMVSGEFTRMAGWLQTLTPDFLRSKL